jgi:hypothetical protein
MQVTSGCRSKISTITQVAGSLATPEEEAARPPRADLRGGLVVLHHGGPFRLT